MPTPARYADEWWGDGARDSRLHAFGDEHGAIDLGRTGSDLYDFCWHTVTPPNEAGYCNAGAELWDLRTAMKRSKVTVAAVNEHLRVLSVTLRSMYRGIDYFIEDRVVPFSRPLYEPSAAAVAVAGHVGRLVRNGDYVGLRRREHLGCHRAAWRWTTRKISATSPMSRRVR